MRVTAPLDHVEAAMRRRVHGEVRFDAGSRAAYSTDASNYRQVPLAVVVPESIEDGVRAVEVCASYGIPLHSRGGGTSLAGQCCNEGVVIDWSKYCTRLVSVDTENRTATVEPGIALDPLNEQLSPHGLMVGQKPSTHETCTIGGMIGNNSCGSTAQAHGKMVDSVVRLEILTYDGLRTWVGPTSEDEYRRIIAEGGSKAELYRGMRELRDRYLADIRRAYPNIPRRVSGYNLDSLLPEQGFNIAKALVGSESTLVTVLRAEIRLVEHMPARTLVVLGYPDIARAGDDVPEVARHHPLALEGLDERLVRLEEIEQLAEGAVGQLPRGHGWLMVQFAGRDKSTVDNQAEELTRDLHRRTGDETVAFLADPSREDELWKARESGLSATAFPPDSRETHEGWEDAAVPPDRLGDYLRDFRDLLERFGYGSSSLYGHFGHGCVHTRIPFDLRSAEGIAAYRRFAEQSARLVTSYGGSLSGEHGDGQSRGELLPIMFGDRIVTAFGEFKALFDPGNQMNPGKIVHPYRLDENLRQGADYHPAEPATHFAYPHDGHRFSEAAGRCVGVGKCRSHKGGVMCPSYRATGEEEHSTRGRARLLYEMLQGDVITEGWRSTEVRDALDLCLACKGCKTDCPVNVDMATYKAEFLSHHYEGRVRPAPHYSMGWLPLWARIAAVAPRSVNAISQAPILSTVAKMIAGVAQERRIPLFAPQRFSDWFARRPPRSTAPHGKVLLWPDTFTNNMHPGIGRAAVQVLESAGFEVVIPENTGCCALTWISTGQLRTAKRVLSRTLDILRPQLRDGTPVVVLEPSCAAAFRSDLPELLYGDEDAHRLSAQTHTLSEFLRKRAPDWRVDAGGQPAIAQVHCHQHADLGFDADEAVMRRCGIDVHVLDAGCCGLAGNFGFERGHYDVSMACAEHQLLPAVQDAAPDTAVLADGFSCRTQIEQSDAGRTPVHLAEILAAALRGECPQRAPDDLAYRPAPPSSPRKAGAATAVTAGVTLAVIAGAMAGKRIGARKRIGAPRRKV